MGGRLGGAIVGLRLRGVRNWVFGRVWVVVLGWLVVVGLVMREFVSDIMMWYWVESREDVLLKVQCRKTVRFLWTSSGVVLVFGVKRFEQVIETR